MRIQACALALSLLVPSIAVAQGATKVMVASDKKTQITVPSTWTVLELNEAAEIQIGSEEDEAYIIVLNEAKADLYGWNLDKHSRVTLGKLLTGVVFPEITGPKSLTISGRPAIQYEIRGAADNRNVIYVHTTIDGAKYFSQVLAWTLPSYAEKVRPQLIKAITTFQEVE
jgi:hypothetical protein